MENCGIKLKEYRYYIWVYILGAVLTFCNTMFWQNGSISTISLLVLYCILFYKGIHILVCYKRTEDKEKRYAKASFGEKYSLFRMRVAMFWLAFIALCVLGKFELKLDTGYFYSCTFFFLLLDRLFVNVGCLLRKCSDPKGEMVRCCCSCPCRGWDLMMIHTPLLFALQKGSVEENIFISLASVLALISFVCWETEKYYLVEEKEKCPKACDLRLCKEHRV